MAMAPGAADPEQVWSRLRDALGLAGPPAVGDKVRLAPEGLGPIEGEVDWVSADALGVRGDDGLYRFIRGFDGSVALGHHLYADDVDGKQAEEAWQAWLGRLFDAS
jgi:hypothetical protein